jgi:hypothetical protein
VRFSAEEELAAQELRESWRKAKASDRVADPLKWDHAKLLAEKRTQGKRPVSWSKLAAMSDMSEPMCKQYVATWETWGASFPGSQYPLVKFDQARLDATVDLRAEQRVGNEYSIAKRVLKTRGCDMAPEVADAFVRWPGLLVDVIGLVDERVMQTKAIDVTPDTEEEAEPEQLEGEEPEAQETEAEDEAVWLPEAGAPATVVTTDAPVSASSVPEVTEEEAAEARERAKQIRRIAEFRTKVAAAPGEALNHLRAIAKAMNKHTPPAIKSIELAESENALSLEQRLEYVKVVDALDAHVASCRQTAAYQKNRRMVLQRRQAGIEESVTE